ncbi:hypothetical protein IAT40_003427 [Kwoniella sp. CBS 6097]
MSHSSSRSGNVYGSSAPPSRAVTNPLSREMLGSIAWLTRSDRRPHGMTDYDAMILAHARSGNSEILGSHVRNHPEFHQCLINLRDAPFQYGHQEATAGAAWTILEYIRTNCGIDDGGPDPEIAESNNRSGNNAQTPSQATTSASGANDPSSSTADGTRSLVTDDTEPARPA